MRVFATCEGVCRERKLELISGDDYDELVAAARSCRVRIERFRAVVEELAVTDLSPASWSGRYASVRSGRAWRCRRPSPALVRRLRARRRRLRPRSCGAVRIAADSKLRSRALGFFCLAAGGLG
jgi:hypothetical protein